MNKQKGFTIIELIVVVAIIAVLAAIVLVNVTSYINKGKDAAIQGNLSSMMTNAAVIFDSTGNYLLACAGANVPPITAAKTAYGSPPGDTATCNFTATTGVAWAACSQLKVSDSYFCVDSTGAKKTITTRTGCTSTAFTVSVCP
jgi:prepilin-type N-terminal cleavage/methylation domain-containing protein